MTSIPLRGMRGMVASKMHASHSTTAPVTHHAEADVGALLEAKASLARKGVSLSVEDLILAVVVSTLRDHPWLNGWAEEKEIRLETRIHLSVAIALADNGLVAPTIFDAQDMSWEALRAARKDLIERAAKNKIRVPEMTGGTFTVSNLGRSRVRFFTPIINAPQIAILGIGATEDRPRPFEHGGVEWRPSMGLSLTFDHRAVDGAPAAMFLTQLCESIEGLEAEGAP